MQNIYNIDIERGVLSALLFEPYSSDAEYLLAHLLSTDFYLPFHQAFFRICIELITQEKPVDEAFVRMRLLKENAFNEVEMINIMSATPIVNLRAYVAELREMAQRRALRQVAISMERGVEEGSSAFELIESSINQIERVAESGSVTIGRKSMADAKESEPEFMVTDWLPIPKGTTSMIVAPGGTGKTWLTLQLAIRMAREDASRKIFLWLSEDSEGIVKSRYEAIVNKILIGKRGGEERRIEISTEDPILLLEGKGRTVTLSSRFYAMKRELREYDVIIIDPLLAFFGGDENDNSQARLFMQPFLNWARSENKVIIFLHHSKKGEAMNASKARGAGAIVDAVRCVYDMDKIYVKKSDGKRLDPVHLHMRTLTLSKDNYGAAKYLDGFMVQREITPKKSALRIEIEFEDAQVIDMPRL